MKTKTPFASIERHQLEHVSGGAARVAAKSGQTDQQLQLMISQLGESIKEVANSKNNSSNDMMMPLLFMMMSGGGSGGGSAPPPPPPAAPVAPTYVRVRVGR